MASELKPCPFCGATAKLNKYYSGTAFTVVCDNLHRINTFETEAEAVATWNTRPTPVDANPLASNPVDDKIAPDTDGNAPAAADTGLVTAIRTGHPPIEYVTRSQAEELLAAKDADIDRVLADNRRCIGRIAELEADNAAQAARIKELDADLKTFQDGTADLVNEKIDAEFKTVDLEAKLAAAEKALESYKSIVKDVCESQRGTKWGKAAECILDAIERAVLGGKPS